MTSPVNLPGAKWPASHSPRCCKCYQRKYKWPTEIGKDVNTERRDG